MAEHQGLLRAGWARVANNKRYIIWFYVLNLTLAWLGAASFSNQAHDFLDHSLHAARLLHGFDVGVLLAMLGQPEFGSTHPSTSSGLHFALLFFFATVLFLPGVFQGYAATYRLPREEFFRACGRNLWRFIRLLIVAGLVMIPLTFALFGLHGLIEKQAAESTNELLLPEVRLAGLILIFLVMQTVRLWFDLAQADVVLSDQRAVRKSIATAFRHTWRNLRRLLGSYIVATIAAIIILVAGLLAWMKFVPSTSVVGAFFVSQLTLLLLLIPRFWQRGVVVSYYLQSMVEPIALQPFTPPLVAPPPQPDPPPPVILDTREPEASA